MAIVSVKVVDKHRDLKNNVPSFVAQVVSSALKVARDIIIIADVARVSIDAL